MIQLAARVNPVLEAVGAWLWFGRRIFYWCTYPVLRQRRLKVPPLRRVTFEKRESNQSALPLTFGASPRLGIPSLR
ncbi:hypothetical protein PMI31_04447, partial [Pseudomonas sp. GM55]